jgi:hypothetical protein
MTGILIVPNPKARSKKAAQCARYIMARHLRYVQAFEKWEQHLEKEARALREAQRITAADLAVTINVRASDP